MRKDIIIIDDDRDLCTLLQESLLQENICADIHNVVTNRLKYYTDEYINKK